jgi:hypothetical protein
VSGVAGIHSIDVAIHVIGDHAVERLDIVAVGVEGDSDRAMSKHLLNEFRVVPAKLVI